MICLQHEHGNVPGTIVCAVCGGRISALSRGAGLPYSSWKLTSAPLPSTSGMSVRADAIDTADGRQYVITEYFQSAELESEPRQKPREDPQKRAFLGAAKQLSSIGIPSLHVNFAYTSEGRCYSVAAGITGTPLRHSLDRALPEQEVCSLLVAVLRALDAIHSQAISAGPLYHGEVTPANILFGADHQVQLAQSTYLEDFFAETRLPPEFHIERDLRGAGLAAAAGLAGAASRDPSAPLDAVKDLALGATLDYLLRPARAKPPSARALITFLEQIERAGTEGSWQLYRAAYELSGSARLLPFVNAPAGAPPTSQAPPPLSAVLLSAEPPAAPAPANAPAYPSRGAAPPAAQPPAPLPSAAQPPVRPPVPQPVTQPESRTAAPASVPPWQQVHVPQVRPSLAARAGRLVASVVLLISIVTGALVLGIVLLIRSLFAPEPLRPPTVFVQPNVIRRGQTSTLRWSAAGFNHIELNGQPVAPAGSRSVSPAATATYQLRATDREGKIVTAQARLGVVQPARGSRRPNARDIAPVTRRDSFPAANTPPSDRYNRSGSP
ncbi:MAG TPA: hypothetical protein VGD59_12710 [Acidisarcina sp.]